MPRILLLLLLASTLTAAGDAVLKVGLAESDITAPIGYRLDGYFHERLATGQKDPLKAKAIVLEQGNMRTALVVCDLLGMPLAMSTEVRALAEKRTGIPATNITIAATHSHTGPLFAGERAKVFSEQAVTKFGKDPLAEVKYPETLRDKLVDVIAAARANLAPASLDFVLAQENRVAFNRRFHMKDGSVRFNPGIRNPDIVRVAGPIDPDLPFLLISKEKKPVGSLSIFALHLDTVGGTEYSADYPGHLENEMRREFGESFISVFGTGTCGDINHIDVSGRLKYNARLIGQQLGIAALAMRPRMAPVDSPSIATKSTRLFLPLRKVSDEQASLARANREKIGTKELPFLKQVEMVTTLDLLNRPSHLDAEVQVLRINRDIAIVTLPGEIFVDLGLAIKKNSPFKHTLIIELANDNPAYIPTEKAFKEGSYETINSRIEPGGGEKLVEAATQLLKELAAP